MRAGGRTDERALTICSASQCHFSFGCSQGKIQFYLPLFYIQCNCFALLRPSLFYLHVAFMHIFVRAWRFYIASRIRRCDAFCLRSMRLNTISIFKYKNVVSEVNQTKRAFSFYFFHFFFVFRSFSFVSFLFFSPFRPAHFRCSCVMVNVRECITAIHLFCNVIIYRALLGASSDLVTSIKLKIE